MSVLCLVGYLDIFGVSPVSHGAPNISKSWNTSTTYILRSHALGHLILSYIVVRAASAPAAGAPAGPCLDRSTPMLACAFLGWCPGVTGMSGSGSRYSATHTRIIGNDCCCCCLLLACIHRKFTPDELCSSFRPCWASCVPPRDND